MLVRGIGFRYSLNRQILLVSFMGNPKVRPFLILGFLPDSFYDKFTSHHKGKDEEKYQSANNGNHRCSFSNEVP